MDYYDVAARLGRIYGAIPGCIPFMTGYALPPLFLVLELTYRCNLTCPYCYVRPDVRGNGSRGREELSAAQIDHIVSQVPPWTLILLSGGEAPIRGDFDEILRKIAKKRRCHVYTNGTTIAPADAERWVSHGLASVGVSVDGPEEIHDSIRGHGTFSSTMNAVKMMISARNRRGKSLPLINLKTTITARNAGSLTDVVHLAEAVGADYCTFQVLNTTSRLGGTALQEGLEYNLKPPDIAAFPLPSLADQLRNIQARTSRVRVRVLPDLPASSILEHYDNRLDPHRYACVSPWTVMYVSPFGDVYPCLNYRVGNLLERPLRELWNCHRYRKFRVGLVRNGLFAECRGCCDLLRRRPMIWRMLANSEGSLPAS